MTKTESSGAGLRSILIATAIAGALGYVIQIGSRAWLDDADYLSFAAFWSALYVCVAAVSGVQNEVTRAARPASGEAPSSVTRAFTIIAAAAVLIAAAIVTALIGGGILPHRMLFVGAALAIGLVGYVLVAVLSGVLYGLRLWSAVAQLMVADVVLRALLLAVGAALGLDVEWLILLVAIPFGLAFLGVWLRFRSQVVGAFRLDVPLRRLLLNAAGTVVAAAAMGMIMNGLPALITATAQGQDAAVLAGLIFTVTLTRSPVVIPLLALQSYFISVFRDGGQALLRRILVLLAAVAGVVAVLCLLAALLGPWVVGLLKPGAHVVSGATFALVTASAGVVAMMCVTGPALIAAGRHAPYAAGWVLAAVLTVAILVLPLPFDTRIPLTLLAPPVAGLAVHLVAVLGGRPRTSA